MSSRTGPNVRAKRPTPSPVEYARPQPGSGPVTSHQQSFNSGANTTGANARISGATSKNAPPAQQQQQQSDIYNPPAGSKLTIGNAVALITLRLGRLETFMNQYQLEEPRDRDTNNNNNNEIMQSILTRISALEQKASAKPAVAVSGNDVTQSVLNRVIELEKNSETHYSNYDVMSHGLKGIEDTLKGLSTSNVHLDSIELLREEISDFAQELKEAKDLLLKLQSFTMETNAKLVNTIFSQVDHFDIQEFENSQDELSQYMCGFDEEGDGDCEGDVDGDGIVEDDAGEEVDFEEDDDEDDDEDETETKTGGIRVNFKELISKELLGISSS